MMATLCCLHLTSRCHHSSMDLPSLLVAGAGALSFSNDTMCIDQSACLSHSSKAFNFSDFLFTSHDDETFPGEGSILKGINLFLEEEILSSES